MGSARDNGSLTLRTGAGPRSGANRRRGTGLCGTFRLLERPASRGAALSTARPSGLRNGRVPAIQGLAVEQEHPAPSLLLGSQNIVRAEQPRCQDQHQASRTCACLHLYYAPGLLRLIHRRRWLPCGSRPFSYPPYHGIWRLVNLRPISAVCWLAGPTMTPSLIMPTTSAADNEFRNATWFALQAPSTVALASFILGSLTAPRPATPSDNCMSPGPHSAIPMPGIFRFAATFARAYLSSSFTPSKSSPFGLRGQGSAFCSYSSTEIPQICAAVAFPCTPRRPSPSSGPIPSL